MKATKTLLTLLALLLPFGAWAETVTIPTPAGTYIDWNACELTSANVENNGANIGSTGKNTVAVFTLQNTVAQDYILTFAVGSKNAAKMNVTLTNGSNAELVNKDVDIPNTGSWTPSEVINIPVDALPAGTYTLTFKVTEATSYAGNWGKLAVYSADEAIEKVPGTLSLGKGTYGGGARTEDNDGNVGWITAGGTARYSFKCTEAGVYQITTELARYNQGGTLNIKVTDDGTGETEVDGDYVIAADAPGSYTETTIPLAGEMSTGMKTMTFTFSGGSSFICNYKALTLSKVGEHFARINGVSIEGQTITEGDDTDWFCQLPADYAATTTFKVSAKSGTVKATATTLSGATIAITDNGDGTYTLPTPGPSENTIVTLTLTPDDGAASAQTTYRLKLFRIGEISLIDLFIDGIQANADVLTALNAAPYTATLTNVFTTIPTVTAKVVDGQTVTAAAPTVSGNTATYTLHCEMAGKTRDYTLTVEGLHIYNKVESDETVELKYSAAGNDKEANVWSNGLYTLSPIGDGWEGSGFKIKGGSLVTLSVPTDIKVKQLIIREFSDNYAKGELAEVASEDATVWLPMKHNFINGVKYDLIVNIDGHVAGRDITLQLKDGSQTTGWLELTVEKQAITTAPVLKKQSVTPTTTKNHCVVALSFDREMQDTEATINNTTVRAEGGSATLYFPIWNLDYDKSYTFSVAAGAAKDNYGNATTEDINITIEVGQKPAVQQATYDYVVSTADEFSAALAAVNASNNSANAERKVIFVRNGDYDFGSKEQSLKAYNVSIVGESQEGVVLHGNRSGITNPVLQVNSTGGNYFQDFTVRNDLDWQKARAGVGVAFSGGKHAVLKNITMQSQQDTQVTGESAYYLNCRIYGAVDFICGGGDHYYDQCELLITNGGHITAPSTSAMLKWGYVFQHCTIDTAEGANQGDGSYNLGRPWQNEPRATFLNTTMNIKSTNDGWGSMGTLPTHFYEYNSTDKNGQSIDLSIRKNSPTSTNSYNPVLTDGEAQKFTVENVLGGTDSWLPTEETVETTAPVVTANGKKLSWAAVDDARCYVIFLDGKYLANVTTTEYEVADKGTYTVRAANRNGGLGKISAEVSIQDATGIRSVDESSQWTDGIRYNLQGQRVSTLQKGLVIVGGKKLIVR